MTRMRASGWSQATDTDAEDASRGQPALPPTLGDRLIRWAKPASLTAAGTSLVVHLVLWALAALIVIGGGQAGGAGGGSGDGIVGVAVVTEAELGQMQNAGLDAEAPAVAEAPTVALPGGETDIQINDAIGGGGSDAGALGGGLGSLTSGMGAGDISGGPGLGAGGAGGGAASFFGVEARGTRFAYIIDVSGSMDLGVGAMSLKRIDILKSELGKSLAALLENAHFFVALFSGDSKPLGGRMEWVASNESGKTWARRTVPLITAEGETKPLPAFSIVFGLRPRPDAIYFMTDGEFDKDYANQIARINADYKIPIHCITFVSAEGQEVMRKIAADSGGTYTHIPGPGG
ncbi:MAG: hypothetical protein WD749_10070 [Phycisphaerales bacterium]